MEYHFELTMNSTINFNITSTNNMAASEIGSQHVHISDPIDIGPKKIIGFSEDTKSHPLKHRWTLWIDVPKDNTFKNDKNWQESMQQLCTIGSVEDFWRLFYNVTAPGSLKPRADLYFFKEYVKPDWEEPVNEEGGCWSLLIPKTAESKVLLDKWWMNMLMEVIGEQFEHGEEICGVCCHIRRGTENMKNPDRIALWTRNAYASDVQISIGMQMKRVLEMNNEKIGYQSHKERAGKRPRDLYFV
eukprot:TRINITY_DN43797_c0_g1_i3.p1 TRINITY_DN43797_c0_g1~~TRINITY_DN43797_c0_g1_i3.p1  ORF type:complete len:244 (+),score=27.42 TRINITY_DN43797_c0_g1_i3:61-792(+)